MKKMSAAMRADEAPAVSPLEEILAAQDGKTDWHPPYSKALAEIRRGEKRSCWMWYIWPSMNEVRQHPTPSMLLSNLAQAQEYLRHETLRLRLVEITQVAVDRLLYGGVPPDVLFDGNLDSTKFHETCTVFAVAALANNDDEAATVFAKGHLAYGRLNGAAVDALRKDEADEGVDIDVLLRKVHALARESAECARQNL